jgi:hypothetical protein
MTIIQYHPELCQNDSERDANRYRSPRISPSGNPKDQRPEQTIMSISGDLLCPHLLHHFQRLIPQRTLRKWRCWVPNGTIRFERVFPGWWQGAQECWISTIKMELENLEQDAVK